MHRIKFASLLALFITLLGAVCVPSKANAACTAATIGSTYGLRGNGFGGPGGNRAWKVPAFFPSATDLMGSMHGFLDKRGIFTDLDVPASMHNGISRDGKTIVGLYMDMMTLASHGYILSNGVFTPFDVPGATLTNAWDINARGQIGGVYIDTAGKTHGFLRSRVGDYLSIDYPGASSTQAIGLNDVGQIVGRYLDATGNPHAFLPFRETETDD